MNLLIRRPVATAQLIVLLVCFSGKSYCQEFFTIQEMKSVFISADDSQLWKLATAKNYSEENGADKALFFMDKYESGILVAKDHGSLNYLAKSPSAAIKKKYTEDLEKYFTRAGEGYGAWISKDRKLALDFSLSPDKEDLIFKIYNLNKKSQAPAASEPEEESSNAGDKVTAQKTGANQLEIDSYTNNTSVDIKKGDKVYLVASGRITYGIFAGSGDPSGISGFTSYSRVQAFPHGSLFARVGNGEFFLVGIYKAFTAQNSGKLQLFVNDGDPSNNSGSFSVKYSINKEIKPAN